MSDVTDQVIAIQSQLPAGYAIHLTIGIDCVSVAVTCRTQETLVCTESDHRLVPSVEDMLKRAVVACRDHQEKFNE